MEESVYAESGLIGRGLGRPVVQAEIYECYTIDLCQSLIILPGYPTIINKFYIKEMYKVYFLNNIKIISLYNNIIQPK